MLIIGQVAQYTASAAKESMQCNVEEKKRE